MTVTAPAPRAAGGGLDPGQIIVAGMQRILVGAVGADVPDDIDEEPGADWTDLGYTTEDGIAFSFGLDTDDLMTSQSLDPVRKLTTGRPKTITASLRQFNETTLILALGGGDFTSDADGWEVEPAPSSYIDERALMVEFEDGAKKVRFVGFRTMVSEAVEFTLVNTEGLVFPLTFSVLANEPHTFKWQGNPASVGSGGSGSPPPIVATGANAGAPGTFSPPGAVPPANLAAMNAGILATPNTVWDEDDYVVLANASECYWTGSVWAVGRAPAP
jgi:hypothetical protein